MFTKENVSNEEPNTARQDVDLCNSKNQIPFLIFFFWCQQALSSRARKEPKRSENSMHMLYRLFTRIIEEPLWLRRHSFLLLRHYTMQAAEHTALTC